MSNYRIITGEAYNGCIPIIVYWVQVEKSAFFGSKWENVKGFDTYKRAKQLLDLLEGR
jgi:hypothetical protein